MNPFIYSKEAANKILKQNQAIYNQTEAAARACANSRDNWLSYGDVQDVAECFISGVNHNDAKAVCFSLLLLKFCGYSRIYADFLDGKAGNYFCATPAKGRAPLTAPQHWFKKYYD